MKIYEYIVRIKEEGIDKLRRLSNAGHSIRSSLAAAGSSVASFTGKLGRLGGEMLSLIGLNSALVRTLGPAAIAATLALTSVKAVTLAADLEQVSVGFEVMLGSAERAKILIADIRKMAKFTPFETTDLVKSSEILMGFGVAGKDIIPTLNMLGDVARGNADKLRLISLAYAQIQAAGRLMGQDLLQLVNAGFNPLQEISRKTGRSLKQLKADMEDGNISAAMVTEAFRSATSEGGRFFGMMDRQSKTFHGMASTLRDEWSEMLITIGQKILPSAIEGLRMLRSILSDITTRVDFTPLVLAFRDTWHAVKDLWGLFTELFNVMGINITQAGALQTIFSGIAFSIRTGFLPLRLLIFNIKALVELIGNSVGVLKGFGTLMEGIFTRNFALIKIGWDQTVGSFKTGFNKIKNLALDFGRKEVAGYEAIFGTGPKAATDGLGANARSSMLGSDGNPSGDIQLKDGIDKITGGGRQSVNVTINIDELIGIKGDPQFNNVQEGFERVREILVKELLKVVNSGNYAASQ